MSPSNSPSIFRNAKALAVGSTALLLLGAWTWHSDVTRMDGEEFMATLNGANERPSPATTTATGTAQIGFNAAGEITYSVSVSNLTSQPSMAHIHGPADENTAAGVLADFGPVAKDTSGTLVSGTVKSTKATGVSLDSLKALIRNGKAYVNVHTAKFPSGEIRGQILTKTK